MGGKKNNENFKNGNTKKMSGNIQNENRNPNQNKKKNKKIPNKITKGALNNFYDSSDNDSSNIDFDGDYDYGISC